MRGRIPVNSTGPGTEPWGGCKKESWRPAGGPGGKPNLERTGRDHQIRTEEDTQRQGQRKPVIRPGQDQVPQLLSPQDWSSDPQLSGEALPWEGTFIGVEAPLLLPWETSREPWCWRPHCPTRPHCARVRGWGTSKHVCWRSRGGVLLGPETRRSRGRYGPRRSSRGS